MWRRVEPKEVGVTNHWRGNRMILKKCYIKTGNEWYAPRGDWRRGEWWRMDRRD